jgi:protein tyrosine phosphatase
MEKIIRMFVEKHEKEKDKLADEFKVGPPRSRWSRWCRLSCTSHSPSTRFQDIQTTDEKRREHNGHDYETTVAEERKNFEKNRYTDILPCECPPSLISHGASYRSSTPPTSSDDRNRVGLPNERYINASMIVHPRVSAPSFICTQGPLPNTVEDFWEMVAIKKARVIVMLCKFDEEDGQVGFQVPSTSFTDELRRATLASGEVPQVLVRRQQEMRGEPPRPNGLRRERGDYEELRQAPDGVDEPCVRQVSPTPTLPVQGLARPP